MSLIQINWRPESQTLRQFGCIAALALPAIAWSATTHTALASALFRGGPLHWDAGNLSAIAFAALVGGACALLAWLRPKWLHGPFVALSIMTAPIGWIVSEILLAGMFFGVFLPVGLALRLSRRHPLQWRFEQQRATYWEPKTCSRNPDRYFKQY